MADTTDFQQLQYEFAAHIRDPDNNPAPQGIEDRRMSVYRELFFNNLSSLLSSTYPVLKTIHSNENWRRLVRQFMIHHRANMPYFLRMPKEFLSFLQTEYPGSEDDFPFLLELAHYEWTGRELSLSTAENDWESIDAEGDLLSGVPVKSNLAYILTYQFPVHNISSDFLPEQAGEQATYLSVFRKADDELGFMQLNAITARLLQLIEGNDAEKCGNELLLVLADDLNYADPDALLGHGHEAMQQMKQSEILLGTRRPVARTKTNEAEI